MSPYTTSLSLALAHLAARVPCDPAFLAHPMRECQCAGLTDEDLADRLGCEVGMLVWLRLCRVPVGEREVRRVAEACGCKVEALGRILGVAW